MRFHCSILLIALCTGGIAVAEELFTAKAITKEGVFSSGIEGPACDRKGNLYAVNINERGTIGIVKPDKSAELWVTLPEGSTGNGIRFDRAGQMYVADYKGHNILKIDPATKKVSVLAHEPTMSQPNDIAIGPDDFLYASDPAWGKKTGQIWLVSPSGKVTNLAKDVGTTNGIEVSPDGKKLYVGESIQRKIFVYDIGPDHLLSNKKLLIEFPDHNLDGIRCDVDGNLYVTRHGAGVVLKLSPEGKELKTIDVPGTMPSNICFGGPDGCTAYVTEVEKKRVVTFRVDRPGLSWQRWQEKP